jgi:hypothetical protein
MLLICIYRHNIISLRAKALRYAHAIALVHEDYNRGAPDLCTLNAQGAPGDHPLTPYDADPVMNYCNPVYGNNGVLSAGDIVSVKLMYPRLDRDDEREGAPPFDAHFHGLPRVHRYLDRHPTPSRNRRGLFDLDVQEERSFLSVVRHTVLEGPLTLVRFCDSGRRELGACGKPESVDRHSPVSTTRGATIKINSGGKNHLGTKIA